MANKYLALSGLTYLWGKIKAAFVPITRTVNGKALSANVTLTAADVGALPVTGGSMTGRLKAQNNTAYTVLQVRNILLVSDDGSGNAPNVTTQNGDIVIVYTAS